MYCPDPYAGELDKKSISFANRNPLNLRPGGGAWVGMVGTMTHKKAGAFVKFDTVENGYRAAAITMLNYKGIYGADTIATIIGGVPAGRGKYKGGWAPRSENDTDAYIAAVEKETGIGRDVTLFLLSDPVAFVKILAAMTRVESGGHQPFRLETIREGVRLAYKRFGKR